MGIERWNGRNESLEELNVLYMTFKQFPSGSKFQDKSPKLHGNLGIGVISDTDNRPPDN